MGYLIVYIIQGVVFGLITQHVAASKGYDGGFWWGACLGIVGLLVVGFRPNINVSTETANYSPKYGDIPLSKSSYSNSSTGTWMCECGASNSNRLNYCLRCRRDRSIAASQPKITCPHCGAQNRSTNVECFACHKLLKEELVPTASENERCGENNSTNNIELLQQLSNLHQQGILTDDEFQKKKTELLSKL